MAWVHKRTLPTSDRLSVKLMATFADRGCCVVSTMEPYGRILGFLDQRRFFFPMQLLNCTHEAEWTLFQTHYFSENLVVLGIEPETSGSVARNSDQ
jgi:hypothetical protein